MPLAGRDDAAARSSEDAAIDHIASALTSEYAGSRSDREVVAAVTVAHQRYADAPIRDLVPLLVERDARRSLSTR